jgi:membrane protein YdbS with pleckstrin-like domain
MAGKAKLIPDKFLSSDERMIIESRPSAIKYMKSAALAIIVGLIALVIFAWEYIPDAPDIPYLTEYMANEDYGQYVQLAFEAVFVLCLFYFAYRWMKWGSTIYAVTDERIITLKGILNKHYEDIPLTQITNVDLSQSIGKRMLGYGTIVISTQGTAGRKDSIVWTAVPDPIRVRRKIQEVMDIRVKPKP